MSREKLAYQENPQTVGDRIKERRREMGYSQGDLATKLGLKTASAVMKYEKGAPPPAEILTKLAETLRVSVDYLLTGEKGAIYKTADPEEDYGNSQRRSLVRAVKRLAREAPDDLIRALIEDVKVFRELAERRQVLRRG